MTIARLPLASEIDSRTASTTKDARGVNCLYETRQGKREFLKRPGLVEVALSPVLPSGQGQGLFAALQGLTVVVNNQVYRISSGGVTTLLGTMSGGLSTYPMISFAQTANRQGGSTPLTVEYSSGSGSWTIPSGVTSITVTVIGAGGGGSAGYNTGYGAGSGGGSGGYQVSSISVVAGNSLSFSVGNGGAGGASNSASGSAGGTSSVTYSATTVSATGGSGASLTTGGSGGAPSGTSGSSRAGSNDGYPGANSYYTALTGVSTYGTGGAYNGGAVQPGTSGRYGGGGGGGTGSQNAGTWTVGGAGGNGYIRIQYTVTVSAGSIMFMHNGVNGYSVAPGSTTLNSTMVNFPSTSALANSPLAAGAVYLDGYVFILTTTGRIYNSNLEDPTIWNALNYISAEAEPDSGVAIAKHFNYVVAFGQWSTEFLYDAGNPTGSPLANNRGARLEIGCANGFSVAPLEQSLIWIGQGRTRGRAVYMLDGLSPTKVSTRYIEKYLNDDPMTNVRSYVTKLSGHTLYVLTLHDSDRTFVFDVDEKMWYQWTSYVGGGEHYFQPAFFSSNQLQYYCMDDDGGKLYYLSSDAASDAGVAIYCRGVTEITDSGTTKRKFYRRLEIIGDKTPATSLLSVRHSGDDYNTWSTYRTVDLSKGRAQLYQLGSARRRAWEFLYTDNYPLRLEAAEIDFDVGDMEGQGG